MNMSFKLRPARREELAFVMQMYNDARSFDGCAWDDDYPDGDILNDDFLSGGLYVFVSKNEIIGAISILFGENLEEFECWKIQSARSVEFARVVVSKEYVGQGYGTKMVFETLELLKQMGYDSARILVSPSNPSAIAVYKKLGFDFLRVESFPYGDFWLCEKGLA